MNMYRTAHTWHLLSPVITNVLTHILCFSTCKCMFLCTHTNIHTWVRICMYFLTIMSFWSTSHLIHCLLLSSLYTSLEISISYLTSFHLILSYLIFCISLSPSLLFSSLPSPPSFSHFHTHTRTQTHTHTHFQTHTDMHTHTHSHTHTHTDTHTHTHSHTPHRPPSNPITPCPLNTQEFRWRSCRPKRLAPITTQLPDSSLCSGATPGNFIVYSRSSTPYNHIEWCRIALHVRST